jgi:hypothetical protein
MRDGRRDGARLSPGSNSNATASANGFQLYAGVARLVELSPRGGWKRSKFHRHHRKSAHGNWVRQGDAAGDSVADQLRSGIEPVVLDELNVAQPSVPIRPAGRTRDRAGWSERCAARCDGAQPRPIRRFDAWIASARAAGRSGSRSCCRGLPKLRIRHAKLERIADLQRITRLVIPPTSNHSAFSFNAAKGGDPMSHGSAQRSERGVCRP